MRLSRPEGNRVLRQWVMTFSLLPPSGQACVILPDAASSARWETADRVFLEEAFTAAGVAVDIQNANGDKAKFTTIAEGMLASGCAALLIVNLGQPVSCRSNRECRCPGRFRSSTTTG